jgi:hypothetical protein
MIREEIRTDETLYVQLGKRTTALVAKHTCGLYSLSFELV